MRLLAEHKVKLVIIGAWAFPAYGYTRNTIDEADLEFLEEIRKKTTKKKK